MSQTIAKPNKVMIAVLKDQNEERLIYLLSAIIAILSYDHFPKFTYPKDTNHPNQKSSELESNIQGINYIEIDLKTT